MGGNALKPLGIEVRRYKTDELSVIEHEVLTRMEKLGFIGRKEGVMVHAVANLTYLNWKQL